MIKHLFLFIFTIVICTNKTYAQTKKLISFSKENESLFDLLEVNGETFILLNQVDTPGIIQKQSSYIIKIDNNLNIIQDTVLRKNNTYFSTLYRLFNWKHPVTNEAVIGFIGSSLQKNISDSIASLVIGFIKTDFSGIFYVDTFFTNTVYYDTTGSPVFKLPGINDVMTIGDSILLAIIRTDNTNILCKFSSQTGNFQLIDSLPVQEDRFYKNSQGVFIARYSFYGATGKDTLYIRQVFLQPNLSLGMPKYFPISSSLHYANIGKDFHNYNDTLFVVYSVSKINSGYNFVNTLYLCKLLPHPLNGLSLYDSLSVYTKSNDYFLPQRTNTLDLRAPYCYLFYDSNDSYLDFLLLWDYEWVHYSGFSNNQILLWRLNFTNATPKQQMILGGNKLYKVNGIHALSDSVVLIYGWEFPLGDSLRHDGDAFIWKISWNSGIVTSVLGETPEYVFKVFPNPASERWQVQGKTKHATTLLLRSTDGKELLRKEFSAETTLRELDVSNLSKGIYLLEIQTSSGRKFTEKVVIE